MGHYGDQFEQLNEETRKKRKEELEKRLINVTSKMDNDDLKNLVAIAEKWEHMNGFISLIHGILNN